jgi:hypothetical protein
MRRSFSDDRTAASSWMALTLPGTYTSVIVG